MMFEKLKREWNKLLLAAVCITGPFSLFSQEAQPACCVVDNFYFTYTTSYSGTNATVSFNPVVPVPDEICERKYGTIASYSWNFGDGSATSSSSAPTHSYALNSTCATSVYTVTVNFVFTTGLTCTYKQIITIQNPNVSSTNSITATFLTCKTYNLSYSNPYIPNAQWAFGDGSYSPVITGTSQSITHTFPAAGTYVVTLTGPGISPCFIAQQVVVSDFVTPDFNYTPNNICNPAAGVTLSIMNYNSSYTYLWTVNGNPVTSLGQTGNYTSFFTSGINTVKLTITDPSSGCSTNVTKVILLGSPSPAFSITTSSLCSGDALSVSGVNPGGDVYTWTITRPDNSVVTLLGMNPLYVFNPTNIPSLAGTYTITLNIQTSYVDPSNPSGPLIVCSSTSSQQLVNVTSLPNAAFTISPSSCGGVAILNMPPTAFTSYTLNYGDGGPSVTGGSSYVPAHLTHAYALNGVYTVSLTLKNNNCTVTYDKNVNITSVAALSINATETNICPGSNTTLTAVLSSVPAGAGTISYSWTGPGGFTSSLPSITVNTPGSYQLTVTSGGSCNINLTTTKVINAATAPSLAAPTVSFASCASATASATLQIPVGLLQDGYCINGNCVAGVPSASSPQNVVINGLVEGFNYITVSNALNPACNTILLANAVRNNPVISLTLNQPTSCGSNGSASIASVTGTVKWYTVANYPATHFATGTSASGLVPGSYVVEVQDGFCTSKSYFNIVAPVINVSTNSSLATCAGNTVPVTLNAAFSPALSSSINYTWQQITGTGTTTLSTGSTNTQSLSPGNYAVHVTGNGCATDYNFTVTQYDPLVVSFTSNSPNCKFQGQVEAAVSGGDGNYSFQWTINGVSSPSTTASLNLGYITSPAVVTATVTDQSGCVANSSPVTITPATPVTLQACSPSGTITGQGNAGATIVTPCDIHSCVTGGTAPYNFEWYKVGTGNETVQWIFSKNTLGQFIASNGTNTVAVTTPANSGALTTLLANNTDQDKSTVCYPSWNFTITGGPLPVSSGTTTQVVGTTTTVIDTYFPVVETVTVAAVESFVASASGVVPTATASVADFTTGEYNLHVTDANGCAYTFSLGTLTFTEPTTFGISFEYVWGMGVKDGGEPAEPQKEDVVLTENMIEAANALTEEASKCMAQQAKALAASLKANCTDLTNYHDEFNIQYILKEHHYTLYYYDRAGQLTKTVPPEGVKFLTASEITSVKNYRSNSGTGAAILPAHNLKTMYHYNSFGQLITQETPDAGESVFIYDSKNRLRFSQNARQKNAVPEVYSYTRYDELGRIIEVGESSTISTLAFSNPTLAVNTTNADNMAFPATGNKQITHTVYSDQTAVTYYGKPQQYLQNRVSYTYIDADPSATGEEQYTYYSYDSHGNVEWLVQDNLTGIGKNYLRYEYDLVSGKVLKVAYNENRLDRFYHKYQYDAENRLTKTLTSRDGELWDEDASYQYYAHGPLKRNVIGEDHVQGLDYIYTIEGWLKSINTPHLNTADDPGQDNGNPLLAWNTTKVAADRNGMMLNYFDGDYKTNGLNFITNNTNYSLANLYTSYGSSAPGLYNGNISSWSQSQINLTSMDPDKARTDLYQYDVLNRIKQSLSVEQSALNSSSWSSLSGGANTFKSTYSYDANGNILTLNRYDDAGNQMDQLAYTYSLQGTDLVNNKLLAVNDAMSPLDKGDIVGTHTYSYDPIGNLIHEAGQERLSLAGIDAPGVYSTYSVNTDIEWTVYGKIREVQKTTIVPSSVNRKERISFTYDASGNRSTKEVWKDATPFDGLEQPEEIKVTYYVRDAQGNVMATYDRYYDNAPSTPVFKYELQEQPIYGSERIGQNINKITLSSAPTLSALASPSSGMNVLSEYENWLTTDNKTTLLPSTMNDNLCNCKLKSLTSNSPANTNYNTVADAVEFLGIANNGIAVAENLSGDLQFYAVLAKKYLGNNDACLIFDKNGKLMKGTENITTPDVNSKPVIINITGTNSYAVVTLDATQQPVYHIVDMNAVGYGPVTNAGEVISYNQAVSTGAAATAKQGYHFTGMEDHINGQSIVYSTRYTADVLDPNKGTTEILAYDFGTSTTGIPQEHLLYTIPGCGSTETGELQISPNGDKLAWYQHDKSISGFKHRLGYIYTMPLTPSRLSIAGTVDIKPASQAGNYGNGMLEFMENNTDILYSQRGLYGEGTGPNKYDRNVWQYDPVAVTTMAINSVSNPLTGYLFGEIRRGLDGNFYIPNMGEPADKIHSYSNSGSWNADVSTTDAAYELASALPTQVFKLFIDPDQVPVNYLRNIQKKEYELKDHLGNVKMVISDAKLINSTDAIIDASDNMIPEILTYTDYYPFGSPMPGRKMNPGSYRYGFNGQEMDDDLGIDMYTAEHWEYDSRLCRRWNLDPVSQTSISDYACFENSPIMETDVNGDSPSGNDPKNTTGINYGFRFALTFGGGASLSAYAGGYTRSGPIMSSGNLSATLFKGGPGTSSRSPYLFNFAVSTGITVGGGVGVDIRQNMLYSGAGTGVVNNYKSSFTMGASAIFSSGGNSLSGSRNQIVGYTGFRVLGFTGGHANDVRKLPLFPFGDAKDQFHSAILHAGYTFDNGVAVNWTNDMYYGKSNDAATYSDDICDETGQNYDNQDSYNMSLNNAQETINVTFPSSITGQGFPISVGIGRIGAKAMWPSNKMHDTMFYPDREDGTMHSFHHLKVLYKTKPVIKYQFN